MSAVPGTLPNPQLAPPPSLPPLRHALRLTEAEIASRDMAISWEFQDVVRATQHELLRAIVGALDRGNLGTAAYLRRQVAAVDAVLQSFTQQAVPAAARMVTVAYTDGADTSAVAAVEHGRAAAVIGFGGGVHEEAVRLLVENATHAVNTLAVNLGRQVQDEFRRAGLRAVAMGVTGGQTRREVQRAMIADLRQLGVEAFRDAAGRVWRLEPYAAMVARTTTREARTHGTINRLVDVGLDLVQIDSHAHAHDACTPYDGKVFSLSGNHPSHPRLERYPPFHPNCRHVLTPAPAPS